MHIAPQTSDYPVILSLENHCSMEQQEVLAQQLKDILGEQLLTATIDGRIPTQLPSPEVGTERGHAGHRCPAWEWGEEVALLSRGKATPVPASSCSAGAFGDPGDTVSSCSQGSQSCPQGSLPMPCRARQHSRAFLSCPLLGAEGSWWCWPPAMQGLGNSKSHGEDGYPKVPTSPSPTPQELKHKILLKGKKIGRLEDMLDGPGDEAPDVSDDDNGAEAEEEKRRVKVGGLGWGLARSAEPQTQLWAMVTS